MWWMNAQHYASLLLLGFDELHNTESHHLYFQRFLYKQESQCDLDPVNLVFSEKSLSRYSVWPKNTLRGVWGMFPMETSARNSASCQPVVDAERQSMWHRFCYATCGRLAVSAASMAANDFHSLQQHGWRTRAAAFLSEKRQLSSVLFHSMSLGLVTRCSA